MGEDLLTQIAAATHHELAGDRGLPVLHHPVAACRRCGVMSRFDHVDSGPTSEEPVHGTERVLLFCCQNCSKMTVTVQRLENMNSDGVFSGFLGHTLWVTVGGWPPEKSGFRDKLQDSVPNNLKELYGEACSAMQARCYRASVLMARAALEAALSDHGATGRTLRDKIRSLEEDLGPHLIRLFDTLRVEGNEAAHVFSEEWTAEEARELLKFLGDVFGVLYVTPERLARQKHRRRIRRSTKIDPE